MLQSERDRQDEWLWTLSEKHGRTRTALLPILQDFQAKYFHIDEHAMQVIADILGLHPVEVYSVVSFYSMLDEAPKGTFVIRLCRTISCDMQGKDQVARQLKNDLGISFGETTQDGMFSLEWTNCLGMCDQGPALLINDQVYTSVTPEKVHMILEECREQFGVHALMKEQS
jgi:[NiFe] hydrogenase diaphorase moiety large subunit